MGAAALELWCSQVLRCHIPARLLFSSLPAKRHAIWRKPDNSNDIQQFVEFIRGADRKAYLDNRSRDALKQLHSLRSPCKRLSAKAGRVPQPELQPLFLKALCKRGLLVQGVWSGHATLQSGLW